MDIFSLVGKITINYSDAVNNIEKVSKSAKDTAETLEDVDKKADGAGDSVEDAGQAAKSADGGFSTWKATLANLASNVITKAVTGCTNLAKSVVDLGTDFTSTMSEVQAISGASDEQMKQLEATARQFGATTVFSANDAAEALKYMSLAGWSVEQSTSALGGVLDLAAASGMELGQASDMVTDYLSAFGMEADKAAYFADLLSYAQSHSNTTAEQLGEAYRNCAANLNAAGQDVETTTSLLEAMANQGYKGSEAGTALTAIMRDVTNAMKDGKIQIGDTTISVMDANGNFRDLTDILTDVEGATDGMGDAQRAAALSSTFTADSTKGLNLILNEGMDKVAGYEEALRNSDGAASDMAATMNDNLKGDLANLNSAFEELKLKIFGGAESPMRSVVQFVTSKVIPAITKLVENMDTVAPVIVALTPVILGIITTLGSLATAFKIQEIINNAKTALTGLFAAMSANPIVAVIAIIAGLVVALVTLWNTNEDFRNAVTGIWDSIKNVWESVKEAFSNFVSAIGEKIEAVKEFFGNLKDAASEKFSAMKDVVSDKFSQIKETMGSTMQAAKDTVSEKLQNMKNAYSEHGGGIKGIAAAAMEGVKGYYSAGYTFIDNLTGGKLSAVANKFKAKMSEAKQAVSNKISEIKNSFSNGLGNAYSTVTNILGNIKNKFSNIMDSAKNIVSNAINKIKSFFNFSWSLPKLKLPHISISGSFSLTPPSVPHFGIEWYKKAMDDGMIMNQPTIFGYNAKSNQFLAGGEAGSETVVGTQSLMDMIRVAVARNNADLINEIQSYHIRMNDMMGLLYNKLSSLKVVMDTGELVGVLTDTIDETLGKEFRRKSVGDRIYL